MYTSGKIEEKGDLKGFEVLQPKEIEQNKKEQTPEQISEASSIASEENKQETPEQIVEAARLVEEANKIPELNDEQVSAYLKKKYPERTFEALDEFVNKPEPTVKEVEKIVNPWADVIDEEDEAYYTYKRETGRNRKEFNYLKEDITKKDALEISISRLKKETGLNLSDAEAREYLEDNLQIDLSDEDAAVKNKIALNKYAKSHRDELLAEQEKYRTPLEAKKLEKEKASVEMVQLENGSKMPKAEYDTLVENRNKYTEAITKAVDSVASFDFVIPIDNNGEKTNLEISYDLSKEDKHSMLSDALDVDATINKRFQTKDGFNHSELSKTLFRGDEKNFNNMMLSLFQVF